MRHRGIDSRSKVADGLLDKGALAKAGPEESQVNEKEDKASLGEGEKGHDQAEKKGNFQASNEIHAVIIVLLDKSTNGLRQRRLLRGPSARRSGRGAGRLECGNQMGPTVGGHMEDGINAEWQQGKGNLARVKPHKGHS